MTGLFGDEGQENEAQIAGPEDAPAAAATEPAASKASASEEVRALGQRFLGATATALASAPAAPHWTAVERRAAEAAEGGMVKHEISA